MIIPLSVRRFWRFICNYIHKYLFLCDLLTLGGFDYYGMGWGWIKDGDRSSLWRQEADII